VRWFVRVGGELHWADTPGELRVEWPDSVPKSFTFIAASLEDNPALTDSDPGYLGNLLSLPSVDRERLLRGNWRIRSQDGAEWGETCWSDLYEGHWPGAFELSAMAIDPSKGREHGDYAAIVFVGVSGGLLWVDAVVAKLSAQAIAEATVALYREHLPDIVGMEDNANQDLAFGALVSAAAQESRCPPLPLVHYTQRASKVDRIYRLGPHVAAKRFRFRDGSRGCELLESQLRGFPLKDVHDDGPDALEQAVRLLDLQAASGYAARDTIEAYALD
jgi:predicted phage terminase large subunit-like protein